MQRWTAVALGVGAAVVLGGVAGARRSEAPAQKPLPSRGVELHVPHAAGSIVLDGDMDDVGWLKKSARTGAFVTNDGADARPYSDARLVWGDGHLYVAAYAADQDIRATFADGDSPLWLEDAFRLTFTDAAFERTIDVSPLGVVTAAERPIGGVFDYGWASGLHVSRELDGTPNDSHDDDEEWLLEMAIPLEALGLDGRPGERTAFKVRRCDTPKRAARVCAGWNGVTGGTLVLD
jgi:hypothetical protein